MAVNCDPSIVEAIDLTKEVPAGSEVLVIVNQVNFEVSHGEAVAIVGVSGSGKSTLLGLLAGLDTPTAGTVLIEGRDIFKIDEDRRAALRASLVGFVFQSFHLLPAFTALQNVMLPLELGGVQGARTKAAAMLERVGLAHRIDHYPKQLSGGEQQRVAIARAFARDPKLLFADEPTGNLDAATGDQIVDLMFELNREQHTTLVLVTHDETISRRCNRQLRLSAGALQTPAGVL